MEDQHSLKPGSLLQNYTIIRILGEGGFGITYLAKDNELGLEVVIKEYFPNEFAMRSADSTITAKSKSMGDYTKGMQRFKEEAQTLAKFNHPSIVKILGYFEANNTAYFVMEYEEGIDLSQYLKQKGKLGQEEILSIMMPILEGLKEVHAANYLHRDIKPGNILLRNNKSPVLIDFGASKLAIGEASKSITSMLTEGYAPLEQYSTDIKQQGSFTDLYAIAAVMYKCITGGVPPSAQTRSYALLQDDPDPYRPLISLGLKKYDDNFLKAVDRALSMKARDRPQNVQEFQEDIAGRLVHEEVIVESNKSSPSRNNGLLIGLGVLVVLAAGVLVYLVGSKGNNSPSEVNPAKQNHQIEEKNVSKENKKESSEKKEAEAEVKVKKHAATRKFTLKDKLKIDALIKNKKLNVEVLVKQRGKTKLVVIKNDQYPENIEESYYIWKNKQDEIIAIGESPFSESGDWFIEYMYYFDPDGELFSVEKNKNSFVGCAEITRETNTMFFTKDNKIIDKTYFLVDDKNNTLERSKCNLDFLNYPSMISKNLKSYLKDKYPIILSELSQVNTKEVQIVEVPKVKTSMTLSENDMGDIVHLSSPGATCKIEFLSMGAYVGQTNCLQIKNSNNVDIFCTSDKVMCKTSAEVSYFKSTKGQFLPQNINRMIVPQYRKGEFNFMGGNGTGQSFEFIGDSGDIVFHSYGLGGTSVDYKGPYNNSPYIIIDKIICEITNNHIGYCTGYYVDKSVTLPKVTASTGAYVCYDKKTILSSNKAVYEGCSRAKNKCQTIGKSHFGKYPTNQKVLDALNRCLNSQPKFVDNTESKKNQIFSSKYSSRNKHYYPYVCYDRKNVINRSLIEYDGCVRSKYKCKSVGKHHFGKYPNDKQAHAAFGRCYYSNPKFIDTQGL